ncbi:Dehydrogenase FUB6 [Fusarium oxysporum f. sp. albedinis]|nr:Dehydrogenase FUB6 [Fusarium oxysporum f. sp. albedinis]
MDLYRATQRLPEACSVDRKMYGSFAEVDRRIGGWAGQFGGSRITRVVTYTGLSLTNMRLDCDFDMKN